TAGHGGRWPCSCPGRSSGRSISCLCTWSPRRAAAATAPGYGCSTHPSPLAPAARGGSGPVRRSAGPRPSGMLTGMVAHAGRPPEPHDLWGAWNLEPVLVVGGLLALWAYRRGHVAGPRREAEAWRARCFTGALLALGVALLSPLDALSSALASAHMVQHMLLVLVAAPLLALSAPSRTRLRGRPLR